MIYDGNTLDKSEIFKEIVKVDDVIEYEYIGEVKKITLPMGSYKLEVYGAEGGYEYNQGKAPGKGGYSQGIYSISHKFETLYVCVGGAGKRDYNARYNVISGGYNGGGAGQVGGGGATHIAISNNRGMLANYVNNKNEVLIVAGGGGGADANSHGGDGGGNVGQDAYNLNGKTYSNGKGGTQTAGGGGFQSGSFGKGGDARIISNSEGAGGGGWYGGGSSYTTSDGSGGGGSGYIGGVSNGTTTSGVKSGNGYAVITWMPVL